MRKLTVVVPTLNEEDSIDGCLDSIGNDERVHVVVSDGGSRDATLQKAHARGATLVSGTAGRGRQLNRGAAATGSDLVLFLHSDCRLPGGWYEPLASFLADPATALACFRLRTVPTNESAASAAGRLWLRTLDLRARGGRLPYGDQGFGVRREIFARVGGFPDIPLMEDLVFARACRRIGRIRRVPLAVQTSARRTERFPVRARFMMLAFPTLFRLGVPPVTLARWYGHAR